MISRRVWFLLLLLACPRLPVLAQPEIPPPPPPAVAETGKPAAPVPLAALTPNPLAAEVQKCEDRVASARRDVLDRYDAALADLQGVLQKGADLDGALAVRAERQRLARTGSLQEADFVADPKALRTLQVQMATRQQDLVTQLVGETVPRLLDVKKQLTIAGKLDEAVAVRASIEHLQNDLMTNIRAEPGATLPAELLLRAYGGDRARADATYKGQKLTVQGTVAGFRPDPADAKQYLIYLAAGNGTTGYVQCAFSVAQYRFREEKQANLAILILEPRGNESAGQRVQRGMVLPVAGTCTGWDETVRMQRCSLAK